MRRFSGRDRIRSKIRCIAVTVIVATAAVPAPFRFPAQAAPAGPPAVLPAVKEWTPRPGELTLDPLSRVVVDPGDARELRAEARGLAADIAEISGLRPEVVAGGARDGDVVLTLGAGPVRSGERPAESYTLTVGDRVTITGGSATGVFYGTRTLGQMLAAGRTLPRGEAADAPDFAHRGLMIDGGRKHWSVAYLKQTIRRMAWHKLNTLHWHLTDAEAFRIAGFPGVSAPRSYTKAQIREVQDHARRHHVRIMPEIDLPGHATAITRAHPRLRWPCESMNAILSIDRYDPGFTVDITKPANVALIDRMLNEIIPLFDSPVIHLGTDETPDLPMMNACPQFLDHVKENGFKGPGDVFVDYFDHLNGLVKRHGRKLAIWGFWPIAGGNTKDPAKDILVEAWRGNERYFLDRGYEVIVSRGQQQYVVPGLPPGWMRQPDDVAQYETFPYDGRLRGYEVAVWTDRAFQLETGYFDWFLRRPLEVLADRTWGGPREPGGLFAFQRRADRIGPPPGVPAAGDPAATGLSGTPYGSASDPRAAFDGDPATVAEGGDAGLDLGTPYRIGTVRFVPPRAATGRMTGGRFQGCADGPSAGCRDIAAVPWRPPYTTVQVPVADPAPYRWVRYVGPAGGNGGVAEIDLRAAGPVGIVAPGVLSRHARAQVTVRNDAGRALRDVRVTVSGFSTTGFEELAGGSRRIDVPAGAERRVSLPVSVPPGAPAGRYRLEAHAAGGGLDGRAFAATSVPARGLDLDNTGVTDDGNIVPGDLDGAESSLSAQALAAAGVRPGGPVVKDGLRFTWPATAGTGDPDNALARGQTVPVNGRGRTLGLLVTGTYTPPPSDGYVTYADGTSQRFTVSVPDWRAPKPPGAAITTRYTNRAGHKPTPGDASLFVATAALDPAKRVTSVRLPNVGPYVGNRAPALHVFALTLAP